MKKLYLIVLSFFSILSVFANPVNTAVQTGNWSTASSWNKGRAPKDLDTVVIPAGKKITFNDIFSTITLKGVYIKVYGTLQLGGFLSALSLDNNSTIVIYSGGSLTTGGLWQSVTIGGREVFSTAYPSVLGPQMANGTSNGFTGFSPLPVKFVGFTVTKKNNDVLIQWSTSQEINADLYQVERSADGSNWTTIAYVAAVGNSSNVNNYSFTDKNFTGKIAYYRIKEVDVDGKTTITPVKSVKTDSFSATSDIKIASVQNKVLLQFPQEIKGNLMVRFVSLGGQVVDQQVITNAVGQVVLNSKVTGNYIISISNGQNINAAKQVIL